MPTIKEYSSTEALQGQPIPEQGERAQVQAGYRVGRAYDQAGNAIGRGIAAGGHVAGEVAGAAMTAYDHQDAMNSTQVTASKFNDWASEYNKARQEADPTDTEVGIRFADQNGPAFIEGARAWAKTPEQQERAVARATEFIQTFHQRATAEQFAMAEDATKTALSRIKNINEKTITENPDLLPFYLKHTADQVNDIGVAHQIKGADLGKLVPLTQQLQEGLVTSAIYGAALNGNAKGAAAILENPENAKYLKNPAEVQEHLQGIIKAYKNQDRQDVEYEQRQQRKAFEDKSAEFAASFLHPDGSIGPPPNSTKILSDLLSLPGKTRGDAENLMHMVTADYNKTWPDQPGKAAEAMDGVLAGTATPLTLGRMWADHDISKATYEGASQLLSRVEGSTERENMRTALQHSAPLFQSPTVAAMGLKSTLGTTAYSDFAVHFPALYFQRVAAGKQQPNDLDLSDKSSFIRSYIDGHAPSVRSQFDDAMAQMDAIGAKLNGEGRIVPSNMPAPAEEPNTGNLP